jgi:hypothetical protein
MIISYAELKKKPRILKGFAGVTAQEFEELEATAEPLWQEQEFKRLDRPDRKRAIGGGQRKTLPFREQLLMTLVWLRLYLVLEALGYLFGVDKSTASRYTHSVLAVLGQVGEATLGWPEPPKRGHGKQLEQVWREQPDLFAYVDATEQRIRRSSNDEQQKEDYSGKKKQHTRKTQLIVNEDGIVRDLSGSTSGSKHDRKQFSGSGAAAKIPKETTVGGDCGYQGIQDDLPDHSVITPFKKSKLHPLTDEQKLLNQEFARGRIIVENTICQFKHFRVLADRFRHDVDKYDHAFRSVLAIVNPRIKKRVAAAAVA